MLLRSRSLLFLLLFSLATPALADRFDNTDDKVEEVISGVCANYFQQINHDAMLRGALIGLVAQCPRTRFDPDSNKNLYRVRFGHHVLLSLPHPQDQDMLIESISKAITKLAKKTRVSQKILTDAALRAAVAALGNCYTVYLNANMVQRLSLLPGEQPADVGIMFSCQQQALVRAVRPQSSAFTAGIVPGDRVLRIAGQSTLRLNNAELYALLSGSKGSRVWVKIRRQNGASFKLLLQRQAIVDEKPFFASLDDDKIGKIAYLRPGSFNDHTATWAHRKLNCKQSKAIILDLRGNGGGRVDEAEKMARIFLPAGLFSRIEGRNGRSMGTLEVKATGPCAQTKIAVLVDGETASAAELTAQALRELRQAPLIGQGTYGKGSVQQFLRFADGSVAKVSTAHYLSPSGKTLDHNLQPDIALPSGNPDLGQNPSQDPAVQRALQYFRGEKQKSHTASNKFDYN